MTAMAPRFSVIMPVYNGGDFIDVAIESVRTQSFGDFELLVCDDGSTDDTIDRVIEHANADERVRLLPRDAGRGPGARRNQGLRSASAAWIAFLDADDLWHPQRLEWSNLAIEAAPDTALFFGDYQRFTQSLADSEPAVQAEKGFFDHRADYAQEWITVGNDLRMLRCRSDRLLVYCCLRQCPISTPAVTLRREILEREGIWFREDWQINEDFHVWMRLLESGPSAALNKVLFYYRRNANSLTSHQIRYLEGMAASHGEWRGRINSRLSDEEQRIYRDKVAAFLQSAAWVHSREGRVVEAVWAHLRSLAVRCNAKDLSDLIRTVLRALWWASRSMLARRARP
jgi:glycosyltransferase involved in cell wall biosynthesis